jgi:hypothetical protein
MATRPPSVTIIPNQTLGLTLWIRGAETYLDSFFDPSFRQVQGYGTVSPVTSSVAGHSRRRFPGGPATGVDPHSRTGLPPAPGGSAAKPGEKFWCERTTGTGANRVTRARQFTYQGSWSDLRAFAEEAQTGLPFTLRNNSGRSDVIGEGGEG